MKSKKYNICMGLVFAMALIPGLSNAKEKIHALYIPLADHYAGIVAHHKYKDKMAEADYSVEMMKSWPELKGKFMSGQADIAFIIAPMAMNMFNENKNFRWVGLAHRNGNALAVNDVFLKKMNLSAEKKKRLPDGMFAQAISQLKAESSTVTVAAVPSLEATHTVALYKYLKDNNMTLSLGQKPGDVIAKAVPPPKSPLYIQEQGKAGKAASFEQSLPWAEIVESGGYGKVAWYSKDVLKWEHGHVECLIIATDAAIKNKSAALKEVIQYVHQAGVDIQVAVTNRGTELDEIAKIINTKYIKAHSEESIKASLDGEVNAINYVHLNNDEAGLKMIMDLAVESGVMKSPISINDFSDNTFSSTVTEKK